VGIGKKGRDGDVRVTASYNFAVGALCASEVEEANHLCDGGGCGATREEVAADGGIVRAADTLDPDLRCTVLALEGGAEGRA
jgi:hypothetical protein